MSHTVVNVNGRPSLPTLLGQGQARIPTGGKIRAGIKVLTKKAAENSQAKEIYDQGLAAGHSFEQIEKAIIEAVPTLRTPLVPKNVPWFTVRAQDFPNPDLARRIVEAHGEDRGDGVKRVYRFPAVFPSDMWQVVMPHEMACWGLSEKRFWSQYSPDGRLRHCMCFAPVPRDETGKRAIRTFGGRKTALRQENGGMCDPEHCREYQQRQCNLSGQFIFFIPGIPSISAFELHTNSFYAMSGAIQKFETIAFLRGGRLSGFLDAKRTPFYFTKTLRDVPHLDKDGRAVRVPQWIIELEAPVDVTALLRENDDDEAAIASAEVAAHIIETLSGTSEPAAQERGAGTAEQPSREAGDEAQPRTNSAQAPLPPKSGVETASRGVATTSRRLPASDSEVNARASGSPAIDLVIEAARSYGIDAPRYEEYADKRWGSGWKLNVSGRRAALEEIERYRNDPDGFLDKIDSELRLAS
jgi:hypothetical protein